MTSRLVALLAVSVYATSPASFAQNTDAGKVLDAAITAHGGAEKLAKYKAGTSQFTGQITIAGMAVDFKGNVTHEVPDKFHMTITVDVGGIKQEITQTVNGKMVMMAVNGAPQRMSDAQKAELMRAPVMQEISQLTPLLDAKRYKIASEKDADVNGKPADVIRVQGTDPGIDVRLYFDKKSHLLVKTSRTGLSPEDKEVKEESVMSDYATVGGLQLPKKVNVTHDGKQFMSLEISETKILDKADPKLFKSDI